MFVGDQRRRSEEMKCNNRNYAVPRGSQDVAPIVPSSLTTGPGEVGIINPTLWMLGEQLCGLRSHGVSRPKLLTSPRIPKLH